MEHRSGRTVGKGSFQALSAARSKADPQLSEAWESWSPRGAETGLQAHRRDNLQPEVAEPTAC